MIDAVHLVTLALSGACTVIVAIGGVLLRLIWGLLVEAREQLAQARAKLVELDRERAERLVVVPLERENLDLRFAAVERELAEHRSEIERLDVRKASNPPTPAAPVPPRPRAPFRSRPGE